MHHLTSTRIRPFPILNPTLYMTGLKTPLTDQVVAPDPLTERVRATWTAGDFGRVARGYVRGASEFIARLGLDAGERVLDVACGTGTLALPAARTGAVVTGVDVATNLITQAKARAVEEQPSILFDIGAAEALAYANDEFDVAVSMF